MFFSAEDFSLPAFFQAIFDDIDADSTDMATYLTTFIDPFIGTADCGMVISRVAYMKLGQHADRDAGQDA